MYYKLSIVVKHLILHFQVSILVWMVIIVKSPIIYQHKRGRGTTTRQLARRNTAYIKHIDYYTCW